MYVLIHTLSIQLCAVRARRRVLPIRRSVRTGRWSSPDVGRNARGVARMGFDYSYSIYAILSLPTDVSVLVVPPPVYLHALTETTAGGMLAVGRVVGVATSEGSYLNITHRRLSFVTVVIELLHGHGLGRCGLSWYLHPPRSPCSRRKALASSVR